MMVRHSLKWSVAQIWGRLKTARPVQTTPVLACLKLVWQSLYQTYNGDSKEQVDISDVSTTGGGGGDGVGGDDGVGGLFEVSEWRTLFLDRKMLTTLFKLL
jgi:hypothetical protein